MRFADDVRWRRSKRGLVLATPAGEVILLEHPLAVRLPTWLEQGVDRREIERRLGGSAASPVIDDLCTAGLLHDPTGTVGASDLAPAPPQRRLALTRFGLEVAGIDRFARGVAGRLGPVLTAPWTVTALSLSAVVGAVALLHGPPPGSEVSTHPVVEGLLVFVLLLACSLVHELGHAVSLACYGRSARRTGIGFYWGSVSFFVDATDALTLPRRERVVQALAGLGVDVLVVAVLAVGAQLSVGSVATAVAWKLAVLKTVGILVNAAPVLEVDGHWALSDWLDEPDLAPRARRALADLLRERQLPRNDRWLPAYGAVSTLAGLGLLLLGVLVFVRTAGHLVVSLLSGGPAGVVTALVLVGPLAAGSLLSLLGLVLEVVPTSEPLPPTPNADAPSAA